MVHPFTYACAQVKADPSAIATSSSGTPLDIQVRDRWDADKIGRPTSGDRRNPIPSPSKAAVESREFARDYVAEKLQLWQQRLKLGDWQITWAMARKSDLKPNTVGQIHWDRPSKRASILVMDSCDYQMPFNAMLDDMELTVIHELVHLKLTSLPHSEASRGSEEQAVNGLSEALFALEHQKQ